MARTRPCSADPAAAGGSVPPSRFSRCRTRRCTAPRWPSKSPSRPPTVAARTTQAERRRQRHRATQQPRQQPSRDSDDHDGTHRIVGESLPVALEERQLQAARQPNDAQHRCNAHAPSCHRRHHSSRLVCSVVSLALVLLCLCSARRIWCGGCNASPPHCKVHCSAKRYFRRFGRSTRCADPLAKDLGATSRLRAVTCRCRAVIMRRAMQAVR